MVNSNQLPFSVTCMPTQPLSFLDRVSEILADFCFKVSVSPTRRTIANEALLLQHTHSTQTKPSTMPTPTVSGDATPNPERGADSGSWMLKANVTVFRHADRTPKQKLKYSFPVNEPWTQPFIDLLNGEQEELILRERPQLEQVSRAIEQARKIIAEQGTTEHAQMNGKAPSQSAQDDLSKLTQLQSALEKKIDLPGTKAQLKPNYKKVKASVVQGVNEDGQVLFKDWDSGQGHGVMGGGLVNPGGQVVGSSAAIVHKGLNTKGTVGGKRLEKFQLVFKWGGEVCSASQPHFRSRLILTRSQFTHAARYQSRDLGENLRKDISILNRDMLNNVQVRLPYATS